MGSSDIIKVDTEQLRTMAGGYTIHSNSIDVAKNNNSGTIQTIIYKMPAYDGRLQQAAKGDILDFNKRADDFANWFKEDSASLKNIAEAFEEVDGETIKIFQQADDMTRASLVDAINNFGLKTTITSQEIDSPPNALPKTKTIITVVRTINPDGSVTTTTTIKSVTVLDEGTANAWNTEKKDAEAYFSGILLFGLGIASGGLGAIVAEGIPSIAGSAELVGAITGGAVPGILDLANQINENHNPDRGWQPGDTITSTTTIITNEPLDNPTLPIPEIPTLGPDITTKTVVTDSHDNVLSEDTTGIGPTGLLK